VNIGGLNGISHFIYSHYYTGLKSQKAVKRRLTNSIQHINCDRYYGIIEYNILTYYLIFKIPPIQNEYSFNKRYSLYIATERTPAIYMHEHILGRLSGYMFIYKMAWISRML